MKTNVISATSRFGRAAKLTEKSRIAEREYGLTLGRMCEHDTCLRWTHPSAEIWPYCELHSHGKFLNRGDDD